MILKTYHDIALAIRDQVPQIIWRDVDKGQLDKPDQFNSLLLPALLIGFSEIDWQTFGQGNQLGEGTVTVKLILRLPAQTHDLDPLFQTNLDELELAAQVNTVMPTLRGIRPRTGSHAYQVDTFYVVEQTYPVCHVPDPPRYRRVPVTVNVTPTIELP